MVKLLTGDNINPLALGVLYICKYDFEEFSLSVLYALQYDSAQNALDAYANTPNPESQLATGNTMEELEANLIILHKNMLDPKWVEGLAEYL